jgi:hypothetical protein
MRVSVKSIEYRESVSDLFSTKEHAGNVCEQDTTNIYFKRRE